MHLSKQLTNHPILYSFFLQILTTIILPVLFHEFSATRAEASPERSASDSDFANTAKHLMQASNSTRQSSSSLVKSKG